MREENLRLQKQAVADREAAVQEDMQRAKDKAATKLLWVKHSSTSHKCVLWVLSRLFLQCVGLCECMCRLTVRTEAKYDTLNARCGDHSTLLQTKTVK